MGLFKAYDIRGVYGEELNEDFAYKLGRSLVIFLRASELIVSRDGRLSSDVLHESLCKGIMDQGCSVHDIGTVSTPHFYYACKKFSKPGVIITASHNPRQFNGFKIINKDLEAVSSSNGLREIQRLVDNPNFQEPYKKGNYLQINSKRYYLEYLKTFLVNSELSFVVDSSNGSGKVEADFLDAHFPSSVIINSEIDGNFPNHGPDPTDLTNHNMIRKEILDKSADFGVLFDGDADRAIFFDENGQEIRPEILVSLLDLKGKVLYDVRSSQSLSRVCEDKGVSCFMIKTGRTNFASEMKKQDAYLGVEGSGHYFLKDFFYLDNPVLIILKLLSVLSKDKKVSDLVKNNTYYYHSGELNFKVKDKKSSINKVLEAFKANQVITLDGYSLYLDKYWFNIRMSNTENLIRVNAEAKDQESLTEIKTKLIRLLSE